MSIALTQNFKVKFLQLSENRHCEHPLLVERWREAIRFGDRFILPASTAGIRDDVNIFGLSHKEFSLQMKLKKALWPIPLSINL
jgi:hypothetical protein